MKLVTFTLMLVFSVVVLAVGTPPLEISREEARFAQAHFQAKQIKLGALPVNTIDPWGSPFTIIHDDRNQIVSVVSPGPDRSTGPNAFSGDDVASGMSSPPHHIRARNRQIQFFVVLGLSAIPWFVVATSFVLTFARRLRPPANEIGVVSQIGPTAQQN